MNNVTSAFEFMIRRAITKAKNEITTWTQSDYFYLAFAKLQKLIHKGFSVKSIEKTKETELRINFQ